jgi:hypothetical protein
MLSSAQAVVRGLRGSFRFTGGVTTTAIDVGFAVRAACVAACAGVAAVAGARRSVRFAVAGSAAIVTGDDGRA